MRTTSPLLLAAAILAANSAVCSAQGAAFGPGFSIKDFVEDARTSAKESPGVEGAAVVMAAFSTKVAPMNFTARALKGTLTLAGGRPVELSSIDGTGMILADGPVSLKYGKPSVLSFVTRDRSVSLTQAGRTAVFPARSSQYKGFGNFTTTATPEQPLVLQGTSARTILKQWRREARHSCSYAGYCFNTHINSKGELTSGYSFSSTCSGSRKVIEAVQDVQTVLSIRLIAQPGGALVGTVVAEPTVEEEWETVENLTSCS